MLASSSGDHKRKAPEGGEMTHSPPPPGLPIPPNQREGAGAPPPPLNLQFRLGSQPGAPSLASPPRFPTPPPLNPQLHLGQPGASSSSLGLNVRPYAPQPLKYKRAVVSEMLEELCKRQYEAERQNKQMEAMLANYRTQALAMAERVNTLEKTNAALNVALHQGGGGDAAGLCKICRRESATMMAWPCRHLCLCKSCAGTTNGCPICLATFQDCIEVRFY
ncbi:PREDICTED: probable E3 ubiquitin-protein ligase LUL4 [Ipomoea nil]|uniref:probable E3 ubiquitin-protein ligase LUL4 n=1 Tax=Ipomoea nil TaxID=35883 RepID=UPI000901EAC6|nr:PREDICTED: probable E3 ubiquitin-protein ligase LUL4 [Ipomoea nil]